MIKINAALNYKGQLYEAGSVVSGLPEAILKGMLEAGTAESVQVNRAEPPQVETEEEPLPEADQDEGESKQTKKRGGR